MVFQTTPWPDRGRKHPPRGGGGVSASRGEVMDLFVKETPRPGAIEGYGEQEQNNRDSRSNSSELSLFFSILIRRDEKKNSSRSVLKTSSLDF